MFKRFQIMTFLAGLLLAYPLAVSGEDCDCSKKKDEAPAWEHGLLFGYSMTNGNSRNNLLQIGQDSGYEDKEDVWAINFRVNNGESESKKTHNDVRGGVSYKRVADNFWFVGLGTEGLHDEMASVDYRAIINPGIGIYPVRNDTVELSVETGPSYIFEEVANVKNDYLSPRIAEKLDWKISETAKFVQQVEVYISAEDTEDTLAKGTLALESALNSYLSLVLSVVNQYDNIPAPEKKKNDILLVTSLKVAL